jgi:hypothetical protein
VDGGQESIGGWSRAEDREVERGRKDRIGGETNEEMVTVGRN